MTSAGSDRIGVGIIGASPGPYSWAANTHVPAVRALPDYELKAVSTSRAESAKAAASAYGVTGFDNPEELIDHPGVELVVIAVKVPHHLELASAALAAGKMVYCEWPLGVDAGQAAQLYQLATAVRARTVIGLQGRYAPAVRHARELIDAGELGQVLATTLVGSGTAWGAVTDRSHAYLYDQDNGATTLTASAMHALDAVTYVLGEATSVSATMAVRQAEVRLAEDGSSVLVTAPDQVAVTGTLEAGVVLSAFYRGGVSQGENLRWEITGSAGELILTSATAGNGNLQAIELKMAGATRTNPTLRHIAVPEHDAGRVNGVPVGPARNVARLYAALARDMATGTSTVPDFGHAVRQHQLVAAIEEASRSGHTQHIANSDS